MTVLELFYFVFTSNLAFLAACWFYELGGWPLAIVAFGLLWWPFLWFFFTGRYGRLLDVFFDRKPRAKDKKSE